MQSAATTAIDGPPALARGYGSLSVVVPVFNEAENVGDLDAEIRAAVAKLDADAEVIYVDDGSKDGSTEVLDELVERHRGGPVRTRVLHLRRNYGQTAAMAAGFEAAAGDVIVPLDGDGQNNPADIGRLLAEYEKGFDVVSGRRVKRQDAAARTIPSRVANWLIGRVTGVRLHDYGCTLKAYRATLLKELHLYGEMHRFIPLYLAEFGARITELPVDHRPRTRGTSKYGSRRIFKVLLDLFAIRFSTRYYTRPMHFFGQLAILFGAALVAAIVMMVVFKYGWLRLVGFDYQATFIQTPLPAMAATFFLGCVLSIFFGILAEILVRIHFESIGRRPYVVEEVRDSRGER
jgi:glycosyltransferase involved in cell wall biosynthesis